MAVTSIQDRTTEFQSILRDAQRRLKTSKPAAAQSLLSQQERHQANGTPPKRSDFARQAAQIGRGISATMGKLERLAQLAKRKTLFDDRPVEINELTFVIKQDLSSLNHQISELANLTRQQHPQRGKGDQEGEHNNNVIVLLQGKLADVGVHFKDVLEVRTKNMQASRSRQENFVSSVSATGTTLEPGRTDSPLYAPPSRGRSPKPMYQGGAGVQEELLSLDPSGSSALSRQNPQSDQQLLLMEEGVTSNSYIQQRGETIETIERTINELGGIFGQLAQMVSEQTEMIQRIDANTEDVVDNVDGAQRELVKYWNRVSGNRWLVAKMFGVLMICKFRLFLAKVHGINGTLVFLLWVLIAG